MTILTVRHVTTYRYRRPIAFGDHRMMFRPRDSYDQRLLDSRLRITPKPARHPLDPRLVRQLRRAGAVQDAGVGTAVREHDSPRPSRPTTCRISASRQAQTYPFAYDSEEMPDLLRVDRARISRPDRRARPLGARQFLLPGRPTPTGQLLMTLTYAIKEGFTY